MRRRRQAANVAKRPIEPIEQRGFFSAFERREANDPIHTDANVKIFIKEGWGIQEMETDVTADVDVRQFEKDNRDAVQQRMTTYFHDEIDIFYSAHKSDRQKCREARLHGATRDEINEFPILPKLHPLKEAFAFVVGLSLLVMAGVLAVCAFIAVITGAYWLLALAGVAIVTSIGTARVCWRLLKRTAMDQTWPGLMEERLAMTVDDRFQHDDSDVRRVIDRFGELFFNNNWMYTRLKRLFQGLAIVGFHVAAAPLVAMALTGNLWTWGAAGLAIAGAWAIIITLIAIWIFLGMTDHIYRDKYYQSLQNSAQDVSNVIRDRMSAINQLYQHTLTHIADIYATGESSRPDKDLDVTEDFELKGHTSFFDTQKMIWLAKRLEYIELYLQGRMHSAQSLHAAMTTTGYIATNCLMILGFLPSLTIVAYIAVNAPLVTLTNLAPLIGFAPLLAAAAFLTLGTLWVSQMSFGNKKWNSMTTDGGGTILEDYLNPKVLDGWQTYNKRQLDVNLGGRFQKAMFRIQSYYDKMGRH